MVRTDYDVVVIGSGFGGSVAALRLAQKGYSVLVLESGRRWADADFPETNWRLKDYLWAPRLGWFGIQRIHLLRHVVVLAGAGVGGGSLNYANVTYVPPEPFFRDPQWGHITDWRSELAEHYEMAQRMLGVVDNPCEGPVEQAMRDTARELGVESSFRKTPVAVHFGPPGERVPDPYFGGAGPERTGCTECGNCMVGCRVGAKNTLPKNYLALAEGLGVQIRDLRTVIEVSPVSSPGADAPAYRIVHERTGAWTTTGRESVTCGQVILAAGTWGTQKLLHRMKEAGLLPRISARLGQHTRTNSESLVAAMTEKVPAEADLTKGVAITSTFWPTADTHVENVRFGAGNGFMGLLFTVPTAAHRRAAGVRVRGAAALASSMVRQRRDLRAIMPTARAFAERTVIGLVMQNRDNSLTVTTRRGLFGGRVLTTRQGATPQAAQIPAGRSSMTALAASLQRRLGARTVPASTLPEALDVPTTAHFMGGAPISDSPATGVIDPYQRLWGYPQISVVDGSAISANLGVNPALTITAQAERALSLWPARGAVDRRPAQDEGYRRLDPQSDHDQDVPGHEAAAVAAPG